MTELAHRIFDGDSILEVASGLPLHRDGAYRMYFKTNLMMNYTTAYMPKAWQPERSE